MLFASHNAVAFAAAFVSAVVSFFRDSERSEESRGSRPTIAFGPFQRESQPP
jgi:hypothetical protein